jgi:hypothetical protein
VSADPAFIVDVVEDRIFAANERRLRDARLHPQ